MALRHLNGPLALLHNQVFENESAETSTEGNSEEQTPHVWSESIVLEHKHKIYSIIIYSVYNKILLSNKVDFYTLIKWLWELNIQWS